MRAGPVGGARARPHFGPHTPFRREGGFGAQADHGHRSLCDRYPSHHGGLPQPGSLNPPDSQAGAILPRASFGSRSLPPAVGRRRKIARPEDQTIASWVRSRAARARDQPAGRILSRQTPSPKTPPKRRPPHLSRLLPTRPWFPFHRAHPRFTLPPRAAAERPPAGRRGQRGWFTGVSRPVQPSSRPPRAPGPPRRGERWPNREVGQLSCSHRAARRVLGARVSVRLGAAGGPPAPSEGGSA